MKRKVLIIGLDCATPQIVFPQSDKLPVLSQLMREGISGPLRSADPPITIPAWMVMSTGQDAGRLGLYGFRHRQDYSYHKIWIATSYSIKKKTIWDYVAQAGGQSVLVGIPPSYPPKPVAGHLISCFITPDEDKEFTYPQELGEEIISKFGRYMFDVEFRTDKKDELLENIYRMTRKRFEVLNYLISTKPWDLFMFVEIGLDRIHHAFWKYMDKQHHLYTPGNPYEDAILNYYRELDSLVGELISHVDKDTVILVVSDHGAKRMKGAFCINEWLIEQGYLVLKEKPTEPTSFDKLEVDWSRTKAWGWGGYYARIFLNIAGREQQGIIPPEDYEKEREILLEKILKISGPQGETWQTRVIKPQEYFQELNGDYPDLMVYFDELYWRSAGTLGHGTMYLEENDTGPDDAVHDFEGIFILYDPQEKAGRSVKASIQDIAPTVLDKLGLPIPADLKGKVIS
ncbi:MAG: nucleotide pyrophosphatase [Candidatus Aminicenantes bacterium]|nr:MAG: nucleotide pyrophosphatase [Candidatus Aminicenantes bacterium]HHF43351.1 nucleotide pyrophosphatase [Candidatus Aminicenantes bacterium]